MKWNKWPETKPVEGSASSMAGFLIYLQIPNPPIDSGCAPGFGWSMRLGYFFEGKWCFFNPADLKPMCDNVEKYITHYLCLIDIPGPEEDNASSNT